ncbi:hypothetical protein DL96DRAFT_1614078, partial [Flagelloscypha sp. PMI_526]
MAAPSEDPNHLQDTSSSLSRQQPFTELPLDILEEIFILAGHADDPSRWTLSLISKQVQKWTDAIVFRHLSFTPEGGDNIHHNAYEDFMSFLRSNQHTDRFTHALSHVRTLLLGFSLGQLVIPWQNILEKFPNLIAVSSVRGYDWLEYEDFDVPHPTLRYACGAFASSLSHFNSSFKALSDITHLEIAEDTASFY